MIIAFLIIVVIISVLIIGRINIISKFHKQVKTLFSLSKGKSSKISKYSDLIGLPEPVQRYFKYILKDGQPYINYARIKHNGQFKTGLDKDWIKIEGEQYATTEKPGFIWKGSTTMFTARHMYIANKGRLVVSLFSLYNVVDAKGENYDQGELLRWLGESVLYPTNLLPSENLKWIAIDATTARLTFDYNGLSLFFIITFNEIGEIIQMETERYMDEKNLATWIIKLANYREWNAIVVPTAFEVLWRLEKRDFSYAKFYIKTIEYEKNVAFN